MTHLEKVEIKLAELLAVLHGYDESLGICTICGADSNVSRNAPTKKYIIYGEDHHLCCWCESSAKKTIAGAYDTERYLINEDSLPGFFNGEDGDMFVAWWLADRMNARIRYIKKTA